MRCALIAVLTLGAVAAQALPQQPTPKRKIPCKTPENAASCYWTRGRLTFYNINVSYRIWKVGTNRILIVYSGPSTYPPHGAATLDATNPELPRNLEKVYQAEYEHKLAVKDPIPEWPDPVFANFEVCPLEPERKGEMQAVCVESAKNIFVQRRERTEK
jgi:hypothetical protein